MAITGGMYLCPISGTHVGHGVGSSATSNWQELGCFEAGYDAGR